MDGASGVDGDVTRRHFMHGVRQGNLIEQDGTYVLSPSLLSLLVLVLSSAFWS